VNAIQPGMLDRNVVSNCPSQLPSIEMLQRPLESTLYPPIIFALSDSDAYMSELIAAAAFVRT
jgi:hypothetical protein